MRVTRLVGLFAITSLIGLSACSGSPPAVTPASPSPSATANASPQDGVYFLEEFNGSALDPERWNVFPQSGIVLVKDGRVDLLNGGAAKSFPYLVTRDVIIPPRGPFSFELAYEVVATGQYTASFSLDYVPPEAPGESGLTTPFMRTQIDKGRLLINFQTEVAAPISLSAAGAGAPGATHRLRVDFDGVKTYQVFVDEALQGTFSSKRRPQKFWVGSFEPKDYPENFWPRIMLDRIQVKREAQVAALAPDASVSPAPAATTEGSP